MTSVRIKICGLRTVDDAIAAADAGADLLGVVLTDSPRRVDVAAARAMARAIAPRTPLPPHREGATGEQRFEALLRLRRPLLVGVFGDEPAGDIARRTGEAGIDVVQLSGRSAAAQAAALAERDLLVVVRPESEGDLSDVPPSSLALLDSPHATKLGGTGRRLNPAIAARCAAARAVVLAGGLDPENVAEAIATVRPWGVDVSSGVETDGAKDHEKIRAFVAAARSAVAAT